jgi:hypothetical protein
VWAPALDTVTYDKELFIYDAGTHVGFLIDTVWRCWKVIGREKVAEGIEETLEEMPADWVPPDVISKEVYTCRGSLLSGSIRIPGWDIRLPPVV